MRILKKVLLILFTVIIIITVVTISLISPITKYLVEKYDEKYTGRQITLDWAYVNPFTGYIHFNKLKIHEYHSDSLFFSANGLSADIAMFKLLSKTYEISTLILDQPCGIVIKKDSVFNFYDLIRQFSSKGNPDTSLVKAPLHFNILKVNIHDGVFYYRDEKVPINYFIKNVDIESTGFRWNADTIAAGFSFLSGIGTGGMKGTFAMNFKTMDYRFGLFINKFDLNILEQYLKDLTNYGNYSANIDANMKVKGNFNTAEDVSFSGLFAINDFHFGKNIKDDYASFDKLSLAIFELSPKNHKYLFDSVSLRHPYFKFELYEFSNNLLKMFESKENPTLTDNQVPGGRFNLVLVIGKYIDELSKNFFRSNYKINRLAVYNGDLKFNDYSIGEKFSIELDPLMITADSVSKNLKRVNIYAKSGIKPFGNASIHLSINPIDSSDFDMQYHFQKIPLAMFNPYLIAYTSFPVDRGTIEINGIWNVRNSNIQSRNHLLIMDPRVNDRLRNKNSKWLPMRLIMAFVRERSNVIDYEIPITGNLKNPRFHLHDVLFDVLGNIFIKPPTTPYGIQVKNIETEIEKSLTLKWEIRSSRLRPVQEKFIEQMAEFLIKNPKASITVHPQQYMIKEKENILFYESKKQYYLAVHHKNSGDINEEDMEAIERMSVKDVLFIRYLNTQTKDSMLFTIQDKCTKLMGNSIVDSSYDKLNKERKNVFMEYFRLRGVEKRIKISSDQNIIPYNGYTYYKIDYKGEYPEALKRAYSKMNELNDKAPRNIFQKERSKNKGIW